MLLYSSAPARRSRQLMADVLVLFWVILAVWLGTQVHDGVSAVADQVRSVDTAGTSLADGLSGAGDVLDGAPLVGDEVSAPFDAAASSSSGIAEAGAGTADSVETLGTWLGITLAVLLLLPVVPPWFVARVRFVLAALLVRRLSQRPEDVDLLALRALARQPLRRLAAIPDAAARWRAGDRATIEALAGLELRDAGAGTAGAQRSSST